MVHKSPEEIRNDFDYAVHVWIDNCGAFEDQGKPFRISNDGRQFGYWIDMNMLKLALVRLIRAYGGDEERFKREDELRADVTSGGS